MSILTSTGIQFGGGSVDNTNFYFQNFKGGENLAASYYNVSGNTGFNNVTISGLSWNNKLTFILRNCGFTSGPQTPVIQFQDSAGTAGIVDYTNILGPYYYTGNAGTNVWVGNTYYTLTDAIVEIYPIYTYNFAYVLRGNGAISSPSNHLIGYGRINAISNISRIYLYTGSSSFNFASLSYAVYTD